MYSQNELTEKAISTAMKLLEHAERAADLSTTPGQAQTIPGVVDAALKLLEYSRTYS